MALGRYMAIGMWQPCDRGYEAHKVLQTSGEVFLPLFWGVVSLIVMNIYSGTIIYVFNILEKFFVPT